MKDGIGKPFSFLARTVLPAKTHDVVHLAGTYVVVADNEFNRERKTCASVTLTALWLVLHPFLDFQKRCVRVRQCFRVDGDFTQYLFLGCRNMLNLERDVFFDILELNFARKKIKRVPRY